MTNVAPQATHAFICVSTIPHYAVSVCDDDDDRRALTSDVTAYVNKNLFRVVQLPFKA